MNLAIIVPRALTKKPANAGVWQSGGLPPPFPQGLASSASTTLSMPGKLPAMVPSM